MGTETVSFPRLRKLGRRIQLAWVWFREVFGAVGRRLIDSHRFPGRVLTRVRLLRPLQTLSRLVVALLAVIAACALVAFAPGTTEPVQSIALRLIPAVGVGLLVSLWHDFFKSPTLARRIRRRIREDPAVLLRLTLAKETMKVVELEPPLETVPRDKLYDELLPGIVARTKDTQIIVGDPGAGKTTALLDLAKILAKIGLVPVLLQLRGERSCDDLFESGRQRFEKQARPLVRTADDVDLVWRWLCRRQRLVFLVDDLDQIGFDGEPGFLMRRLLEGLAPEGQAVVVTARPSGVPIGIAASAIEMEPLSRETAEEIVRSSKRDEPGATIVTQASRRRIESWVRGGDLREAPLYLEALAEMVSVGACPDLPEDPRKWGNPRRPGRSRERSDSTFEWNPLWVRYLLLESFRHRIADGRVRRSLAIDPSARKGCIYALEGAALGVLAATGLEARAAARHPRDDGQGREGQPQRKQLVEFISADDRKASSDAEAATGNGQLQLSQHEAIDTGERLRILDRDQHGEPQFRHRIMQAYFAGRCLGRIGRRERTGKRDTVISPFDWKHVCAFDDWVTVLMDLHHPERLTTHLALTFAAIYADAQSVGSYFADTGRADGNSRDESWDGLGIEIARRLVFGVAVNTTRREGPLWRAVAENGCEDDFAAQLDPMAAFDPSERDDPDDNLVKLTTAANLLTLLKPHRPETVNDLLSTRTTELLGSTPRAMRWTKQQALPAIAGLNTEGSWVEVWKRYACDDDYDVRRSASRQLERNARRAFECIEGEIGKTIRSAQRRSKEGKSLVEPEDELETGDIKKLEALGWVLPAIVSGLSERSGGAEDDGADCEGEAKASIGRARRWLADLVTLAYEGRRAKLEDAVAQGFKADAMRHASDPTKAFTGPGWVAGNRRLIADVLPRAESWYARMLLYQALTLYAIVGTSRQDTMDVLARRVRADSEPHPLAREAAKLSRAALRRAQLGKDRWAAYVWSDDIEDAGTLPATLGSRASQLVGDVTVFVDLKEGSPPDQHEKFGDMDELPYCLSASPDRHEILGTGCPAHCGWNFCPYRAAAPDTPGEHRGVSRGFCRGQRRATYSRRSPPWQRKIPQRKMREFWQQMEYKARR
ncbi:MAG: NACHT domain-containing protein [Solirubrobacterales bacterium]